MESICCPDCLIDFPIHDNQIYGYEPVICPNCKVEWELTHTDLADEDSYFYLERKPNG